MSRGLGLYFGLMLAVFPVAAKTPPAPYAYTDLSTTPFSMGVEPRFGELTYAGGLFLTAPRTERLGGVSGLEARAGPDNDVEFAAVTDLGDFVTFTGRLDEQGKLAGAADLAITALRDEDGRPFASKVAGDAEDLSESPDGTGWLISFEQRHRARLHADPFDTKGRVSGVNIPSAAKSLPKNRGLEAVAALADGRTVFGAEDGRIWVCPPTESPCPLVQGRGGMGLLMMLTSLDTLGGEDLVATYRRPRPMGGFDVAVVRVTLTPGGAVLTRIADLPAYVGNVEGIAAIPKDKGWRLYLITDNGADAQEPTQLMAFDWTPNTKKAGD